MTTQLDLFEISPKDLPSSVKSEIAAAAYINGIKASVIAQTFGESRERTCQRLRRLGLLEHGRPAGAALQALDEALLTLDMPDNAGPNTALRLVRGQFAVQSSLALIVERMQALRLGVYAHDLARERWCSPCRQYHALESFSSSGHMCRAAWNRHQRSYATRRRREAGVRSHAEQRALGVQRRREVVDYSEAYGISAAAVRFGLSPSTVVHYRWVVRHGSQGRETVRD
jgi:hypothetical protein